MNEADVITEFMKDMKIPANQLRIAVVGKTGQGKSSTLNSLSGQNLFMAKRQPKTVTQHCQKETVDKLDHSVELVDTPGMFDPETPLEETQREIKRCIDLTLPGPHIVLFTMRMDTRISSEDRDTFNSFIDQFGRKIMQHMIISMTHYDLWKESGADPNEFVRDVQTLIPSLKNHKQFMPFDNTLKGFEAEEQLDKLMNIIMDTYHKNNGRCYTNELYLARAKEICTEKREEEQRKNLEKEKEMQRVREEEREILKKEHENIKEMKQLLEELNEEREKAEKERERRWKAEMETAKIKQQLKEAEKQRREEAERQQRLEAKRYQREEARERREEAREQREEAERQRRRKQKGSKGKKQKGSVENNTHASFNKVEEIVAITVKRSSPKSTSVC